MKKLAFIIPFALVALVCWAANEVSYRQFKTDKYRSSTLTFDVNSNVKDDAETVIWNFKPTADDSTVMRRGDVAYGTFTNATEELTGSNYFGLAFSAVPTVVAISSTNLVVEAVSTNGFTWSVIETNTIIRWIATGAR